MTANRAAIIFMAYTVLFVWFFGCALDYGESMRFMWLTWSFRIVLVVLIARWLYRRILRAIAYQIERLQYGENEYDTIYY